MSSQQVQVPTTQSIIFCQKPGCGKKSKGLTVERPYCNRNTCMEKIAPGEFNKSIPEGKFICNGCRKLTIKPDDFDPYFPFCGRVGCIEKCPRTTTCDDCNKIATIIIYCRYRCDDCGLISSCIKCNLMKPIDKFSCECSTCGKY
jgi:hypothetical protein